MVEKQKELDVIWIVGSYAFSRIVVNDKLDCLAHLRSEDMPNNFVEIFYNNRCISEENGDLIAEKMRVRVAGEQNGSIKLSVVKRSMAINEVEKS